jgi:hypothetical protein
LSNSQANNIAVDCCTEKAYEIALKTDTEFKYLNTWLQCFKRQWNITWSENVAPIITQSTQEDKNKTALSYNVQPQTVLDLKGEKCQGGKEHDDRMMIMLCYNEDGSEKFHPLVVRKF